MTRRRLEDISGPKLAYSKSRDERVDQRTLSQKAQQNLFGLKLQEAKRFQV